MTDPHLPSGWAGLPGSDYENALTAQPRPIGPWGTPGGGWPSQPPPPLSPRLDRPHRRGRWAIPLVLIYLGLQGIRVGLSTRREPISVTLSWDLGLAALIVFLAAFGRRRLQRRSGRAGPASPAAAVPTAAWVAGAVAVIFASSLVGRNLLATYQPGIAGAPGYTTFGGPHGYPLAVGRPWGHTCQPILFQVSPDVPAGDYGEIGDAVSIAHADGLDVELETRDNRWVPAELWPPGQTNATVRVVPIFGSWDKPPTLTNGHVENIQFGWDAAVSPDGHHEHLTDFEATLWLSQVDGRAHRLQTAVRQLIAYSQGVGGSSLRTSGIAEGTSNNDFSPADLHAIAVMSGCGLPGISGIPAPPK